MKHSNPMAELYSEPTLGPRKYILEFFLMLAVGASITYSLYFVGSIYLTCFFSFCVFFIAVLAKQDRAFVLILFCIGYLHFILFASYWESQNGSAFYGSGISDDFSYEVIWSYEYFRLYGGSPFFLLEHFPLHNSPGYVYLIVLLRSLGELFDGYHTYVPRVFNLAVLLMISLITRSLCARFSENFRHHRLVMCVIFLYPTMIFVTSHLFRDVIVAALSLFFFYIVVTKEERSIKWSGMVLALILFVLSTLRAEISLLLIAVLPILWVNRIDRKAIVFIFPIGILMMILVSIFFLADDVSSLMSKVDLYDSLNQRRFGTIGNAIMSLPKIIAIVPRMLFLVFTPVPSLANFHQAYTSISALIQVSFLPALVFALLSHKIDFRLKVMFLALFASVALGSLSFRHVVIYLPLGVVLVALFFAEVRVQVVQYVSLVFGLFTFIVLAAVLATVAV